MTLCNLIDKGGISAGTHPVANVHSIPIHSHQNAVACCNTIYPASMPSQTRCYPRRRCLPIIASADHLHLRLAPPVKCSCMPKGSLSISPRY